MIVFYKKDKTVYAVHTVSAIDSLNIGKLSWLFGNAEKIDSNSVSGFFIGPRKEMITPWSTNAVEITQNMGISDIKRIEEFENVDSDRVHFDPMLKAMYNGLNQEIFTIDIQPEPIISIEDIRAYSSQEGLALNDEEIAYLEDLAKKLGRKLTDSEVFQFSQVNSEHCRHKIFGGTFKVDGEEKEESLL